MLQGLDVFLVERNPKTEDSTRGAGSPERSKGDNHLPGPAGHTTSDTTQDAIGLLGHVGTLLAHVQTRISRHPHSPGVNDTGALVKTPTGYTVQGGEMGADMYPREPRCASTSGLPKFL